MIYTDPSGEFIFTIIGALLAPVTGGASLALGIAMDVGGAINLGSKAIQGKIHSFGDGLAAYGIGAAAGAVGYATGGAAFAAAGGAAGGAGGFLAGFAGGAVGSAYSMPILSAGNSAYFGDPMMTPGQYAAGILTGGLLGGGINGGVALLKGRTFWTGTAKPVPSNWQSPPLDTYHSGYQNPSEIKIPERLSYYTADDPSTWTSIGTVQDKPIYFTPNSELSRVSALNDLALPRMPNFRVDMTSPNLLDPNKIMIIRRVTGNVFGQGGGGWEIMYRGPLDLNQVKVVITVLP